MSSAITPQPAFTSISIDRKILQPNFVCNVIHYNHNSSVEKPAGNGNITVKIFGYRSDYGPSFNFDRTEPLTRFGWQDSEDGDVSSNLDDTTNTILGAGSFAHKVGTWTFGVFPGKITMDNSVYVTWYYTIKLFNAGVLIATYGTSFSDFCSSGVGVP